MFAQSAIALFAGRLTEITAESIAVTRVRRRHTFGRSDILEVKKSVPDRLWDGGLFGLVVGFGGTYVVCRASVEEQSFLFTPEEICLAQALLFGAPGGLALGLLADSAITKTVTVYRSPGESSPRVRVSPLLTPSRAGLRVAVRLGR